MALFDTTTNDMNQFSESERIPQTHHTQRDLQIGHNKKQSYLDRKAATNYHAKENGRISSKDKHVMMKPKENLKQPESIKRKVTGRLT